MQNIVRRAFYFLIQSCFSADHFSLGLHFIHLRLFVDQFWSFLHVTQLPFAPVDSDLPEQVEQVCFFLSKISFSPHVIHLLLYQILLFPEQLIHAEPSQ